MSRLHLHLRLRRGCLSRGLDQRKRAPHTPLIQSFEEVSEPLLRATGSCYMESELALDPPWAERCQDGSGSGRRALGGE